MIRRPPRSTLFPLHDALPIWHLIATPTEAMQRVSSPNSAAMMPVLSSPAAAPASVQLEGLEAAQASGAPSFGGTATAAQEFPEIDRKSTRLNSSHANISYAVF